MAEALQEIRERRLDPPLCNDCGVDTSAIHEWYMVRDQVWIEATDGEVRFLCIGCLETRLGRTVMASDFTDYPVNNEYFHHHSDRLLARLGDSRLYGARQFYFEGDLDRFLKILLGPPIWTYYDEDDDFDDDEEYDDDD